MKVYERICELKDTEVTVEQMADWAYMNRICPVMFEDGLELDCEYPKELQNIAVAGCDFDCGFECLEKFLNSGIEGGA